MFAAADRPVLLTPLKGRNMLAGIEQTSRVEGGLYPAQLVQLLVAELAGHLVNLFATYAVFTGNGSAHSDALLKNFTTKAFGFFQFTRHTGIEQNERV